MYAFPPTRFVLDTPILNQIGKVLSEAEEVGQAIEDMEPYPRVFEECVDTYLALETLFRCVARDHGELYLYKLFAGVECKVSDRGNFIGPERFFP